MIPMSRLKDNFKHGWINIHKKQFIIDLQNIKTIDSIDILILEELLEKYPNANIYLINVSDEYREALHLYKKDRERIIIYKKE
jgi:ABC-type transporter Mla MlaB component